MSVLPDPKMVEEIHKQKLRMQMHHDLCVLSASSARTAEEAVLIYKKLWSQVMKEIP